jgi:hypothetical protein
MPHSTHHRSHNLQRLVQHHEVHGRGNSDNGAAWNDFYVYDNGIGLSIPAGQATQQVIQIEADSEFCLMRMAYYAEAVGETFPYNGNQQAQISLQLQDGSTSRNLFSEPLPIGMVAGTGQLPFVLPVRRIFPPNGTINLQLFNFGAVQYNNVVIALEGVKIFKYNSKTS